MTTPIADRIRQDLNPPASRPAGPVAALAAHYQPRGPRLLGFLLKLGYEEMTIVTNDVFKANCDGVPRNSFVIVKLGADRAVGPQATLGGQVILARVTEAVPTPIDTEIQQTVFQVHKLGASVDAFTNRDLQWGALKATILGTYYDTANGGIGFGNDVASYLAPHSYEVYVPTDEHLATLINSFIPAASPFQIGELKYTESPPAHRALAVPINVDLDDFIGRDSANRTALFGKTRMGKSNTIKIIADGILRHPRDVAQLIFDPSGEYTYINEQDGTSLYALHPGRCVRYSLLPRLADQERALGFTQPLSLRVNFYDNPSIAVPLIQSLFDTQFSNRPNYILPLLDWQPSDAADAPDRNADQRAFCRFWRTTGLWYAALQRAEYDATARLQHAVVHVPLRAAIKALLAQMPEVAAVARIVPRNGNPQIADDQPFGALPIIYEKVLGLWRDRANAQHFPDADDGTPYFTLVDQVFLRILGDRTISGVIYLRPFRAYHDREGRNAEREIIAHLDAGRTVMVDYANAPEGVVEALSRRIAGAVLGHMMHRFAENDLGDHFVVIYFEEAHRLFRADDKDINGVYNRLAKEGAKFHVGMVYATQSMTTLSPDLRKNTENFIVAHLNDDREIRELTQRYEFRDVGEDVMRARTKGYVRMITDSHRFVLPVRIRRFGADQPAQPIETERR
jgi:hypothetical protein